ncbi:alpha/beta hydrolase [Phycicoccus sp. Root101]|uniref:alpha/beta hydrolase n=1 Tax=Phycicoccus sp. Root101 TaxID=1736421 RepID=UPI0012FB61AD|nr:alpha/beta hydrolase [Phycicoccus sp. Root101]
MSGYRHRGAAAGLVCLLSVAMLSACTSPSEPEPFRPSLVWAPCPDDVETTFLSPHECGTLTVLANRSRPTGATGATVKLLVAKVPPPAGATMPGLGTSFGPNFGDAEAVGGAMAAGTARLGRTNLQMEWRGSGPHNQPSLRCPEVDPIGVRAAGAPNNDPGLRGAFVAAVAQCAKRLRASGVEPADYTSTAMAQDMEDLRVAAGIDRWAMGASYGTQSAVLFEYLRLFPGRVQAAYLDSPAFTSPANFHDGAVALQGRLDTLFDLCAEDAACRGASPDLEELWTQALERTRTHPLRGTAMVGAEQVAVVVDAPKLVRAARFALGGEGGQLAALPRIITGAAHGQLAPELATMVASDPAFCSGYRPQCRDKRFSLGVFLTDLCSTWPSRGTAPETTRGLEDQRAVYAAVFEESPYADACAAWDVPVRAAPSPSSARDVPMLMLTGDLDSFSPPATVRDAADRLGPVASVLLVPGGIHNVLGFYECAITARNNWTRRPTQPTSNDACHTAPAVTFR